MAKSAMINVRIEPDVKAAAEELFSSFGITISDAVNIFIRKSLMEGGIPFSVRQPVFNAETEAAMKEARKIASGRIKAKTYRNARELLTDITDEV